MVKEVPLFRCVLCRKIFAEEEDARDCCKERIKKKKNKESILELPEKIIMYECPICGLRHKTIEKAKYCEHWSDDPSDFNMEEINPKNKDGSNQKV